VERPDDLELVRLILARQRLLGLTFEVAWARALGALPPLEGHSRAAVSRDHTLSALQGTQSVWREGYERPVAGRLAPSAQLRAGMPAERTAAA
jgi:hypothetical protein